MNMGIAGDGRQPWPLAKRQEDLEAKPAACGGSCYQLAVDLGHTLCKAG